MPSERQWTLALLYRRTPHHLHVAVHVAAVHSHQRCQLGVLAFEQNGDH